MVNKQDVAIIRELAGEVADIAGLPVQEEKRELWRKLNGLKSTRPMVMIDQICWNEINDQEEMVLQCTDKECRQYEENLRRTLYQWKHFPVDMVVEPFLRIPKAIRNADLGVVRKEETIETDPTNSVVSHKFENQFQNEEDLEKIREPKISLDTEETERRMAVAHELFDGLLEVRSTGLCPHLSMWDPIAMWMGVENALYALIDRPDFMHRLVGRVANGYMSLLDQLEDQGLLCDSQSLVHCTGAYTDELPAPGFDPEKPRTKDLWMYGLAQMFATVSPDMFREYEVDYASPICERFGLVYYGCCDPLDKKMKEVRMIPNVRKVSMSPWADQERGAEEIGTDYVFSRKPNPAFLAMDDFDADLIRNDLVTTKNICDKQGCSSEYILKDISTIRYEPERLSEWARITMEVVQG